MDKIKIFLVDDSFVALTMLKNILKTDESIEIVGEEKTGQASIIMLDEVNPDLVLLEADIAGGMALNSVVEEIKKADEKVKIILCADPKSLKAVIPAVAAGIDDFISKPYRKESLLRSIHSVVGR